MKSLPPSEALSEERLSRWIPRPPSSGLERRLFGRPDQTAVLAAWAPWATPAFAALAFLLSTRQPASPGAASGAEGGSNILAFHGTAATSGGLGQRNRVPATGVVWTNLLPQGPGTNEPSSRL